MKTKPRILVSVPDDRHLDDRRRQLKQAIVGYIAAKGYNVDGFERDQFQVGLTLNLDV